MYNIIVLIMYNINKKYVQHFHYLLNRYVCRFILHTFKTLKPIYNGQFFWSRDCPLYIGSIVL